VQVINSITDRRPGGSRCVREVARSPVTRKTVDVTFSGSATDRPCVMQRDATCMKRRSSILAMVTSTALCAAAAALWIRSYWAADTIGITTDSEAGPHRWISSSRGAVCIRVQRSEADPMSAAGSRFGYWRLNPEPLWEEHEFLGFGYHYDPMTIPPSSASDAGARVPWWSLLLLAGALSFRSFRRLGKQGAVATACADCGYDLRATPERCPECGKAAVAGRPAAA
jgi:hypothetical protein